LFILADISRPGSANLFINYWMGFIKICGKSRKGNKVKLR